MDSVAELAQRNAANLAASIAEVNEEKNLVRALPNAVQLAGWIEQARGPERAVHK